MARDQDPGTEEWVARQVNRAVAEILRFKDEEVDPHLPDQVAAALRGKIRKELHDLRDVVQARVRTLEEGGVLNQAYLDKLDEVHADLQVLLEREAS